jgi:uncharacterized protein involved in outer membrane biogenesis
LPIAEGSNIFALSRHMRSVSINLSRRTLNRLFFWSAASVIVYTVLGFFVVPLALESIIPLRLTKILGRHVVIERLRFNPYTFGLSARGVRIYSASGKGIFASADEFYLNVRMTSLFRRALVFGRVRVEKPYLALVRAKNGSYDFEDLLVRREIGAARLSLNNIRVTNGSVDFRDDVKGTIHTVRDMTINIPSISNIPYYADVYIHPLFSAAIDGAPYEIKGRTKPFARSLETEVRLVAENVALLDYASYLPPSVGFRVLDGILNLDLTVRYSQYATRVPSLVVSGDVGLEKLVLHDRADEPLAEFPRLTASLLPTDVLARNIRIGMLALTAPSLNVVRDVAGRLNISSILPRIPAGPSESPPDKGAGKGEGVRLSLEQATISKGKIAIVDEYEGRGFRMAVDTLNVRLDRFDSGKSEGAPFSLSAHTDAEEQIHGEGSIAFQPLSIKGQASFRSLAIDRYSPYYKNVLPFLVEGGRTNLSFLCSLEQPGREKTLRVSAINAAISNVSLREPGRSTPFLVVPILSVSDARIDTASKRLTIEAMTTDKGLLTLSRSKSGRINVFRMMKPARKNPAGRKPDGEKQEKAWIVDLKRSRVRGYSVSLKHEGTAGKTLTTRIEDIDLGVDGFSTEKGAVAQVGFSSRIGGQGGLSARGPAGIDPLFADLQTTVRNMDLAPFQPYIPGNPNLSLEGGSVSSEGVLSVREVGKGRPTVAYSGALSVIDVSAIDTITGNTFLAWKLLSVDSFSVGYNPLFLRADALTLTDYYLRVVLGQDGVFNVQRIMDDRQGDQASSRTPPASGARSSGQAFSVLVVGPLTLQAGTIDFTDHYVSPSYFARLTRMSGTISSISSESREPARIGVGGQVNGYAPMKIGGEIGLFGPSAFLDVSALVDNPDPTSMSPHAARYVGYTVQRGALTLDATYLVADRKLQEEGKVGLDQFQLGTEAEGTVVVRLPVKLALSVPRDREENTSPARPATEETPGSRFGLTGAR